MENTAKKGFWGTFKEKHPAVAQFIVFFIISNGVTVLQMIMMPAIKYAFGFTSLVNTNFQILPIGHNLNGSVYYVFDYDSDRFFKRVLKHIHSSHGSADEAVESRKAELLQCTQPVSGRMG